MIIKKIFRYGSFLVVFLVFAVFIFIGLFTTIGVFREKKINTDAAPDGGRFVQSGDLNLYVQENGDKDERAIIFIGGTGAWSGLWSGTVKPIAGWGYRTIAFDIPPFGFSDKPGDSSYGNSDQSRRIISAMNSMGIQKATLVGHSFGGGATLETALTIPERIEALVLLDVGGMNINAKNPATQVPGFVKWFLNTPAVRTPLLFSTATNELFTRYFLSLMMADKSNSTEELASILIQPLVVKGSTNSIGNWLNYTLTKNTTTLSTNPENYKKLTMPVLIVWGDQDTVIPISEGEYLQSLIPNSEMVIMNNVNHIPHLEANTTLIELIREFLIDNKIK